MIWRARRARRYAAWYSAAVLGPLVDRLIGIPPGVPERHELTTYYDD